MFNNFLAFNTHLVRLILDFINLLVYVQKAIFGFVWLPIILAVTNSAFLFCFSAKDDIDIDALAAEIEGAGAAKEQEPQKSKGKKKKEKKKPEFE